MSFRLVPNSVTLDDLERCNRPNGSVISPNSVAFGADYVKMVEDRLHQYFPQRKCRPKNRILVPYHLWRYWQITPSESVKMRHSPLASENMTNNQP